MDSKITKSEIEYIAELARIALTDEEKEKLVPDFNIILDRMDEIISVDTDGVSPCESITDLKSFLREDVTRKCLPREELLSNAPSQNGEFFIVPEMINKADDKEECV